jgi:hypothetical protein
MTPEHTRDPQSVLEKILATVRSIDGKVDDILEQLGEYLDDTHYRHNCANGYHNGDDE